MNSKQLLISLFTLLLSVFSSSVFSLVCENNTVEEEGALWWSTQWLPTCSPIMQGADAFCSSLGRAVHSVAEPTCYGCTGKAYCEHPSSPGNILGSASFSRCTAVEVKCACEPGQNVIVDSSGDATWCSDPFVAPGPDPLTCQDSWDVHTGGCGDYPADCSASGGAFGWVDMGDGPTSICVPADSGNDPPECNVNGFNCNTALPSDPSTDGSGSESNDPADPGATPGDGSNEDSGGTPNNQIGTDTNSGAACNPDTDGATCIPNDVNGDGKCDPATEPNCLANSDKAEGTCDPNEPGYETCIGSTVDVEGLEDFLADNNAIGRDNAIDRIGLRGTEFLDGVNPVTADHDSGGLGDIVAQSLPSGTGCSPLGFEYQGHAFSVSCDVSDSIKSLFGFALYIYGLISISGTFFQGGIK